MSPKAAPSGAAETAVAEALAAVLSDPRLQVDLPTALSEDATSAFERLRPPPAPGEGSGSDFTFGLPESGVIEVIAWLVVVGVVGYLLFLLLSARSRKGRRPWRRAAPGAGTAPEPGLAVDNPPEPVDEPVAAAMRLADEGRLVDAVRLLQQAAEDLLRARGHAVDPAATSREIHDSLRRATGVADIFGAIVRAVERALFGGQTIDRRDVERCSTSFLALRDALGDGRP